MKKKKKNITVKCPYCGRIAVLRDASFVHKNVSFDKYLYVCSAYPACDSYVGVHAGTFLPKGSLANKALRAKRINAHKVFDALWKNNIFTKKQAYRWMQDIFCLDESQAHIAEFSEYRCETLIRECQKVLKNHNIKTA